MAEQNSQVATRNSSQMARREPRTASPFRMLERFADEMDRVSKISGLDRPQSADPRRCAVDRAQPGRCGRRTSRYRSAITSSSCARIYPGMKKEDVTIDVTDDGLIISGERHQEQEHERGGVYRSERSSGSFTA